MIHANSPFHMPVNSCHRLFINLLNYGMPKVTSPRESTNSLRNYGNTCDRRPRYSNLLDLSNVYDENVKKNSDWSEINLKENKWEFKKIKLPNILRFYIQFREAFMLHFIFLILCIQFNIPIALIRYWWHKDSTFFWPFNFKFWPSFKVLWNKNVIQQRICNLF